MPILLTDRRGVFYEQPGRGELMVLHVSPSNQRTVLKDLQGNETRQEVATRAGLVEQTPLWRYANNQVVLYGTLVRSISERVQAVKVWLAEDFAPKESNVFYFVFGEWTIHGRRETDDEGNTKWRVTALHAKTADEISRLIRNSLNDQLLLSEETRPCVSVHNDAALTQRLNADLEPFSQKVIPFAALRPAPMLRPLYTQRNNTMMYMILLFVTLLSMVAAVAYTLLGLLQLRSLENTITDLRVQISQIEINKQIGYIRDPQPVLDLIRNTFHQQPSAILDASARFAALFGELDSVQFAMPDSPDAMLGMGTVPVNPLEPGQYLLAVSTRSSDQKLLVAQEATAKELVEHMPWIRMVENISGKGDPGLKLRLTMQIESSDLTKAADEAAGNERPATPLLPPLANPQGVQ